MGAERLDHHGVHDQPGQDRAVRVGANDRLVDELLDHDDHPRRGERRLLLAAEQAPHLRVAVGVGALGVDDRDVRLEGRDRVDRSVAVGRLDRPDERVGSRQIGALVGAEREEGQVHGAGGVAGDHAEVAVLLQLEAAAVSPRSPDEWRAASRRPGCPAS